MKDPNAKPTKSEEKPQPTAAQQEQFKAELQNHFNKFKRQMKLRSKSELVAVLWEQGIRYKELQDIAQELFEENKALKGENE